VSISATGGLQIYPYSCFLPNFQLEEVKLTDGALGPKRPTSQSDLYYTELTNMFYIRKSALIPSLDRVLLAYSINYVAKPCITFYDNEIVGYTQVLQS
jgi:hypothetical protein